MAGFLEDLLGYKTIVFRSSALPTRSALSIEGAGVTVEDDPIGEQTVVTIPGAADVFGAVDFEGDDTGVWFVDPLNLNTAAVVRVNASGDTPVELTGISIEDSTVPSRHKTLVNVGNAEFILKHQVSGVAADERFVLPDAADYSVVADGAVEVFWIAASAGVLAGWRVL